MESRFVDDRPVQASEVRGPDSSNTNCANYDFKLLRFETKLMSCDDNENVAFKAVIDASLKVAPS